jgi:diaminohydroxyphosphoribosylaminopyrimidine deaminase/5-amino-6-(5-phosphoribosylamino)uracil reductase
MIDAGCEVECGVMEKECRWINRRFFTYHEKKRPYIILKWAESADGFIDRERETGEGKTPAQVTGMPERVLVHRWRAEEQSILAGAATIRADDPLLNVRYWTGNDPLRVILSGSGVMDNKARVFNAPGSAVVFTRDHGKVIPGSVVVKLSGDISAAGQISDYLYGMGIQSLFIEGGAVVLNHFISEGTWDEARVFTGADPLFKGVKAPSVKGTLICRQEFNRSCLKVILNDPGKKSEEVDNFNKIV